MAQVVLVLHGETQWNRNRLVWERPPTALTTAAAALAERLADRYAVGWLLAPDLRRTLETARPISRAVGCEFRPDRRWRERYFGVLQGLGYGELFFGHRKFTLSGIGFTAARPEGGESLLDQRECVLSAFATLREEFGADETAVVVTRDGPLYLVLG